MILLSAYGIDVHASKENKYFILHIITFLHLSEQNKYMYNIIYFYINSSKFSVVKCSSKFSAVKCLLVFSKTSYLSILLVYYIH